MASFAFTAPVALTPRNSTSQSSSLTSSSFTSPLPVASARPAAIIRARQAPRAAAASNSLAGKRVLVIGGTRFSGLYLVHELTSRGADVVILNRGSKPIGDPSLRVPNETDAHFADRNSRTSSLIADRTDADALAAALAGQSFDIIYDNNGRKLEDSVPLVDFAKSCGAHFVYMSSAGVYLKSPVLPHIEGDETDPKSRHIGKLDTENYLRESKVNFTSIRPTYIYGALNYNPLDQWFYERLDRGMPICVPGHGAHLTGLGHVRDLASAMAACAGKPETYGEIYNIQDRNAVTFDGVAKLCAKAMGVPEPEIIHYNPKEFDFGKKKAFPFRPQHYFCSPNKALLELDWTIEYDLETGLKDAYENDFVHKKTAGGLKNDFTTDEMIIQAVKGGVAV